MIFEHTLNATTNHYSKLQILHGLLLLLETFLLPGAPVFFEITRSNNRYNNKTYCDPLRPLRKIRVQIRVDTDGPYRFVHNVLALATPVCLDCNL